ncbi:MAG: hypothetical protein QHH24_07480 [Candidatus Bathyarchaeota archaeon]|jgi:hypothetical protein|nr:hypothetical protein [Candidatus Bathyarchaeota archaeon]
MALEEFQKLVVIAFGAFFFIMLLPALLELKKPGDAGPRRIEDCSVLLEEQLRIASLERTEDMKFDQALVSKVSQIIAALPNLET